ncbi:hypothetical protein BH23GEM3_BH23GEM3_26770 [soil metagenome]|nr:PhzF family phenazine biosynthesis protein [Gemmatimonadota bacterium]
MGLRIVQVDAFADRLFAGNPAAVCVLPETRAEEWMQAVAVMDAGRAGVMEL